MAGSVKKLLPVYLVVGEDKVKRDEVVLRLVKRLEATGMADFNMDDRSFAAIEETADVLSSLNTFPMGTDFRLVILRDCPSTPRKDIAEMLIEYCAHPCETTVCLIIANKLAKNTRLYKAVAKIGKEAIISCENRKSWDMPNWVRDRAPRYGRTINSAAAEELVARVGESTSMLDTELKRVISLTQNDPITRSDIERWVTHTAEVKPWNVADAVAERNLAKAFELLRFTKSGTGIVIHKMIVDRLRNLIYVKSCIDRGRPDLIGIRIENSNTYVINKNKKWAQNFKMEELEAALRGAIDVEQALKGSRSEDIALRMWIADICKRK